MLTHGAKHLGGMAVPAIRVGVGGHRPRRASQLALISALPTCKGEGVTRRSIFCDSG